jgi:general secretion pathway protein M
MAAIPLLDRLQLNPRERRLATLLVGFVAVLVILVIPVGLETLVHAKENDNDELRAAIKEVQAARPQVRERQARKDSIQQRYAHRAPALAGFLEQSARALKLEVTDSVDRPEVPHGKRYEERNTIIHMKRAGMYSIAKFLETLEKSQMAIAVTRLNIRKRAGEPDSYDVEVGVSAYDRNEPTHTSDSDQGDKDKGDKDKGRDRDNEKRP